MDAAAAYYHARGWQVERVHETKKALDLRLTHSASGEVRRVEVKGSSQAASDVEVTKAEVARSRQEVCELFVLDKILYKDTVPGPMTIYVRAGAVVPETGTRRRKTLSQRPMTIIWTMASASPTCL